MNAALSHLHYHDQYVTVYNKACDHREADVIVLDPPHFLEDVETYKSKVKIIFTGQLADKYIEKVGGVSALWWKEVPDELTGLMYRYDDMMVVTGMDIPEELGGFYSPPVYNLFHQYQRPVRLLISLLEDTEGDVLDPFCGSGSTAVACKLLKRKCIVYDIDEQYCEITANRLRSFK